MVITMQIKQIAENGVQIAVAQTENRETILADAQSALDFAMTVKYEYQADRIAIEKRAVADDFFILSTGLAGEILQKYMNYGIKLAIFGDFTTYTSKPLRDFIRESNRGNHFFFVPSEAEAIQTLSALQIRA